MKLLHRLIAVVRRSTLDVDMAEEMRAHLGAQIQRNFSAGTAPNDASSERYCRPSSSTCTDFSA
jgi:hypothetical protein